MKAFPYRGWSVDTCFGHIGKYNHVRYGDELVSLVRRGAEQGLNLSFVSQSDRGGVHDRSGTRMEEATLRLGMRLHVGGHFGGHAGNFLSHDLIETQSELFRMDESGKRRTDGNFCPSNIVALGRVSAEVAKLALRHPGASLLHVWADDAIEGSWCNCPQCKGLSASEQHGRFVLAAAGAADATVPTLAVDYLLYHDTLFMGQSEITKAFPPNVYATFAPRERCYAHAINDPNCRRNQIYWKQLKQAVKQFNGRVTVFEYYGDAILWPCCTVSIPRVIAADMEAYSSLGIPISAPLIFGQSSFWLYGLNLAVFAAVLLRQRIWIDRDRHGRHRNHKLRVYSNPLVIRVIWGVIWGHGLSGDTIQVLLNS